MKTYRCICCDKEVIFTRTKINKYCSNRCQKDYEYKTYIKNWFLGNETGHIGKILALFGHVIKNMPRDKFEENLKEHENGDIAYELNDSIDYEKKYNNLVNSIKHNIRNHTGGDE